MKVAVTATSHRRTDVAAAINAVESSGCGLRCRSPRVLYIEPDIFDPTLAAGGASADAATNPESRPGH